MRLEGNPMGCKGLDGPRVRAWVPSQNSKLAQKSAFNAMWCKGLNAKKSKRWAVYPEYGVVSGYRGTEDKCEEN